MRRRGRMRSPVESTPGGGWCGSQGAGGEVERPRLPAAAEPKISGGAIPGRLLKSNKARLRIIPAAAAGSPGGMTR